MDNVYHYCPPKMSDGRHFTSYNNPVDLNRHCMLSIGLNPFTTSEHTYRTKLQDMALSLKKKNMNELIQNRQLCREK